MLGLLWIGRHAICGRIIGRHGRPVGIGRIGKAGARVGVNVVILDLPCRAAVLLTKHFGNFLVGAAPRETAATTDTRRKSGCNRHYRKCALSATKWKTAVGPVDPHAVGSRRSHVCLSAIFPGFAGFASRHKRQRRTTRYMRYRPPTLGELNVILEREA